MDFLAAVRRWGTFFLLSMLPIVIATLISKVGKGSRTPFLGREAAGCSYQFLRYMPAPWESDWYRHRHHFQQDETKVCAKIGMENAYTEDWMKTVKMAVQHSDDAALTTANEHIFSELVYENTCNKQQISQLVEPLVGNFRHPHSIAHCKPAGPAVVGAEDRDYILLAGMSAADLNKTYPGRKYLFDLGTGRYGSSLAWLVDAYRKRGVEFDEVSSAIRDYTIHTRSYTKLSLAPCICQVWAWEVNLFHPIAYWEVRSWQAYCMFC